MDRFFNRSTATVASELIGMPMRVNDHEAVIKKVKAQFNHENERWTDRPLFQEGVEAYVAPYRGTFLTFLRTGQACVYGCVRLDSVEHEDGVAKGPGQVSKLFELQAEQIGKASLNNGIIVIEFQPVATN